MKKRVSLFLLVLFTMGVLSGCVYSNEIKQQNSPATGEYMSIVQNAVDQYQKRNGVPPIQNKAQNTPIYEKYLVDFGKLRNYNLISTIPGNAFENGGTAIYVLVNVETKPEVKLMDLQSYQKMVELQKAVDQYKLKHQGLIPKGDPTANHFYLLDGSKLNGEKTQIQSPYSRLLLNVIIHESGHIALDYTPELLIAMSKKGLQQADAQIDLRTFLVDEAYFVPAWSYPYRWVHDMPTISEQ
jgi:hypothetical protein